MSQVHQNRPWAKLKPLTSSLKEIILTENPHFLPSRENDEISCRIYKDHMNQFWIERSMRTPTKDVLLQQENAKNRLQKFLQAGIIICLNHLNSPLEDYIFEPIEEEDQASPDPVADSELLCPSCKYYTFSKVILAPCLHSFCDYCVSQLKQGPQKCSFCCEEEAGRMNVSHSGSTGESDNSVPGSTYLAELNGYYEGEWKGEKPHGNGKIVYCYGAIYEGEWKDGKPEGKGKLNYFFKYIYEGQWKNGKKDGEGKMTYFNGESYEGGFKEDKKEGTGRFVQNNSEIYEGEWKNDKKEGFGKNVWGDETVYVGEFQNGVIQGKGKIKYYHGASYEGEFRNHKKNGEGVYYNADGSKTKGKWKNGKLQKKKFFKDFLGKLITCGAANPKTK